ELGNIPQKFEIVEVTIGPVCEIGVGFRKDDVKLRDEVQKVFDSMIVDGTAKKISEQWFHADLIKRGR
ncbi:MAG: transporter substrate-binding domain-containing protein, partial [Selenomonadaceae bacterium]|nr:transporter substrate-binding domain-containing protein [Selenomonadaceae bacterium]